MEVDEEFNPIDADEMQVARVKYRASKRKQEANLDKEDRDDSEGRAPEVPGDAAESELAKIKQRHNISRLGFECQFKVKSRKNRYIFPDE